MNAIEFFNSTEGTLFFSRQLDHLKAKAFEVLYEDLYARKLFPVNNETHPGAKTVSYEVFDGSGEAKFINGAGKDLPRVDVDGRLVTSNVRPLGAAFGFDYFEIQSAAMAGVNLNQRKVNAAIRAIEQLIDDTAFLGHAPLNIGGLLTNTDIPKTDVANGDGGDPEWTEKTYDEILVDINTMLSEMVVATKQKILPNRIVLPTAQYNLIAQTQITSLNMTIMNFIIANNPWIKSADQIISCPKLTGAGTSAVDLMFCYNSSPDYSELEIPLERTFLPSQIVGLENITPVVAVTGGLNIYHPLAYNIKESI
jgi:hypothetical protein